MTDSPEEPQPSARDCANAAFRADVAARMAAQYHRVLTWATATFGAGYAPSGRHFLIDKTEEETARREGRSPCPAATVFTVKHTRTGQRRHFTVLADQPVEQATWEAGFGGMLLEADTTRTIEVAGQQVHPHRYSLCWAPFELYQPRSAVSLAKLRAARERGKQERADRQWAEDNPLIVLLERGQTDQDAERER